MSGLSGLSGLYFQALLIASAIITSNIGARFVVMDLDRRIGPVLAMPSMKFVYVFAMSYMGVRNAEVSAYVALTYLVLISMLPVKDKEGV